MLAASGANAPARHNSAARAEPLQHDAVEYLVTLDVGKMPGVGDLLVAAAGDELCQAPIACRRRSLVVGTAHHQRRHLQLWQVWLEIEIENGCRAAEIARRGGTADGG